MKRLTKKYLELGNQSINRIVIQFFLFGCCIYLSPILAQSDSSAIDPLFLNEVVVSDFKDRTKLKSPNSISTISNLDRKPLTGVADLLQNVPGFFVDASLGDAFSRVFSRGISLSAEDDIGWYYTSLQEDGLPVTAVQYQQFTPDFFVRPHIGYDKIEVMKGGKSSILAANAPGGIVNLSSIAHSTVYNNHDIISAGIHSNGRPILRMEGYANGPIGQSGWSWGYDYFYRYDRGSRNVNYSWNDGGQFKGKIAKVFDKGIWSFSAKYLADKVNRHLGLAAKNWDNPEPAFGHNWNSTSLLPPAFEGSYPDPRDQSSSLVYNPKNGIQTNDFALQSNLDIDLSGWRLTHKLKYSKKSVDWQTAIGGQPLRLDNFISYFISGDPFPAGLVDFNNVASGNTDAVVNNIESFGVFQGLPPGFEYINGSLPNDAINGLGAWKKDDHLNEWMNDLRLSRKFADIDVTMGTFVSRSTVDVFTNASFLYSTFENEPQLLEALLSVPGQPSRQLSDSNGLSNYGGLFYEGATIKVNQFALFGDFQFDLTESLDAEIGLRYESIGHSGTKDRFAPIQRDGGLDSNPLTSYDNGLLVPAGQDDIDFNYNYLNYSAAANYSINSNSTLYARYTAGNKSPELSYYINNFSNVPVNQSGTVQKVKQLEVGTKYLAQGTSITLTGFWSQLSDVPYSEFVFDSDNNSIFYTPTQFNSSRAIGIEIEGNQLITDQIGVYGSATLQTSEMTEFSLYDASGTTNPSDDITTSFAGNKLPHNPNVSFNTSLYYDQDKVQAVLGLRYTGSRYGNFENSFQMAGFSVIDASFNYQLSKQFNIGLSAKNLLNSAGLINFFGPNQFGSSANQATTDFIASNPNASFVVFPILPRTIMLSVGYRFIKS